MQTADTSSIRLGTLASDTVATLLRRIEKAASRPTGALMPDELAALASALDATLRVMELSGTRRVPALPRPEPR